MAESTKEPQYQVCFETLEQYGCQKFGIMSNHTWVNDPKRLLFLLARYKFVGQMFAGFKSVLEIGCADAFGSRIVAQSVKNLVVSDFDPVFIADVKQRNISKFSCECIEHDILKGPMDRSFDGVFSLDVLEHIAPESEDVFFRNIVLSLNKSGVLIIGTPSLNSQAFASPESKAGHINCKSFPALKALLSRYFKNVFIFSMNDEVVHTGYQEMAHYFLGLCCYPYKL